MKTKSKVRNIITMNTYNNIIEKILIKIGMTKLVILMILLFI